MVGGLGTYLFLKKTTGNGWLPESKQESIMAKKKTISVQGADITLMMDAESEFISLTDIDRKFEGNGRHIENWLRNQNTVEYLATWEMLYNPGFNSMHLNGIREQIGLNRFLMSVSKWIEMTNAIGIKASAGRYGGTFAHPDIAFHFCLWLSPTFQLYIAKEFQRLKEDEAQRLNLDWNLKRQLAKANWHIHTEAVREHLVPLIDWNTRRESIYQASEADLLNLALFGMTAREWKLANPEAKGNLRDNASTEQLLVLANLQALNAKLIEWDSPKDQRLEILNKTAREQMHVLVNTKALENLKQLGE